MIYKYKINYKSIGGSSFTSSSTSSSLASSNSVPSSSNSLDNKIEYIDNIIKHLSHEETNPFYYTVLKDFFLKDSNTGKESFLKDSNTGKESVKCIKEFWEKSKDLNPNERIIELLKYLEKEELKIKNFNIFNTKLLNRAIMKWRLDNVKVNDFYGHISDWDTSYVTNMRELFFNEDKFNEDITKWDTSNVTDMSSMFEGATSFNQNIGSWNTSNVTDMSFMFKDAKNFNGDISSWNTSNVRYVQGMFEGAESFNQNINTKSIENSDGQILYTAWDVSNVAYLYNMFKGATSFNGFVSDWTLDPNKSQHNDGFTSDLKITLYLINLGGKYYTIKNLNPFTSIRNLKSLLFSKILNEEIQIDKVNYQIPRRPSILTNTNWYPKIFFNKQFHYENDESISKEDNKILYDEKYREHIENLELSSDERKIFSYGVKNGDKLSFVLTSHEEPPVRRIGNPRLRYFNITYSPKNLYYYVR